MRGIYVLLIHVPYEVQLRIGALGDMKLKAGYYAYVGSALGSLEKRVQRHLSENKKIYWHIDYLLAHGRVIDIVQGETTERKECAVAAELSKHLTPITGFGSSDCKCGSHLFFNQDINELRMRVLTSFKECGIKPVKIEGVG
jgi:Uri superfamily endonuclease